MSRPTVNEVGIHVSEAIFLLRHDDPDQRWETLARFFVAMIGEIARHSEEEWAKSVAQESLKAWDQLSDATKSFSARGASE